MPASIVVAAPDSTTRMRQIPGVVVVDPAAGDPAAQVNAATLGSRLPVDFADGTYATRSPLVMRTAAGFRGDGPSVAIRPAAGFVGEAAIVDEEGAHLSIVEGIRVECASRCAGIAIRAGGPFSGEPNTSPDSHHRIRGVDVFYPKGGVGIVSGPGTDGIRGGHVVDCLIVKGALVWEGSDVWIDDVTCRDSPVPLTVGGGSSRVGVVKAFYSTGAAAVRISGTGTVAMLVEAQDAGTDGIVVAAADVTIRHATADSCGRLAPGDGVVIAGPRATVNVRARERGQTPKSPMRNGVRLDNATGAVLDVVVSGAISGLPIAGATGGVLSLRVNGAWRVGAPSTTPVDVTSLVDRLAAVEGRLAGVDSTLSATTASVAAVGARVGELDAAVASISALDDAVAAAAQTAQTTATRAASDDAALAAARSMLPDLDTKIAAISSSAPKARIALEAARAVLAAITRPR